MNPDVLSIQTSRGPIKYQRYGSGPPMILVHGFLGRPQDFRWLLPVLSEQFELFLPELPGMVSTSLGDHPPLDLDGMSSFLSFFTEQMGIDQCTVVGHSMGAAAAVSFCIQHSEQVKHLGLISPVGPRMHASLRQSNPKLAHQLLSSPLAFLFRPLFRYGLQKFGFPRGVRDESIVNAMWFNSLIDYTEYTKMLQRLRLPTFVCYSTDDGIIESNLFTELLDIVPHARHLRFDSGGHNPQKYHAGVIASSLIHLMNDEAPPPRSHRSQ